MRNSSLVEGSCAENVTGLKSTTEAAVLPIYRREVGERSQGAEACYVSTSGALGSENDGMSSDNPGENPGHRKHEVSYATLIGVG